MSTRKQRGLSERIYLLNANFNHNSWELTIKGSSKSIYKIKISSNEVKCKCMDFAIRKKVCKHLHFILGRVIKDKKISNNITTVNDISTKYHEISESLKNILSNHISNSIEQLQYDTNENCCICFEPFGNEEVEQCEMSCKNVFHKECIKLWLSNNSNCPLCRSDWLKLNNENPLCEFDKLSITS
jgi:hypothetical protein